MRKIVSKCLILIGILILSATTYLSYDVEKTNKKMVDKYEKSIQSYSLDKNQNTPSNIDENIPNDIIGILEIPKIDLKVAVQEGTDKKTLNCAVGHFKESAMPGEIGNCAVAGHRNYTYNKFFSNLDKLEDGDKIKITTKDDVYTYTVYSLEVVTPDKVEVLNSQNDEKTITLITCTPKYLGTHRLVIKGKI